MAFWGRWEKKAVVANKPEENGISKWKKKKARNQYHNIISSKFCSTSCLFGG
jgi:hypothetical protein